MARRIALDYAARIISQKEARDRDGLEA